MQNLMYIIIHLSVVGTSKSWIFTANAGCEQRWALDYGISIYTRRCCSATTAQTEHVQMIIESCLEHGSWSFYMFCFLLVEWRCSWGSVLLLTCLLAARVLKTEMCMGRAVQKTTGVEYEFN